LRAYSFPGNVRELENILERALAFANNGVIEVADLVLKSVGLPAADVLKLSNNPVPLPTQPQTAPKEEGASLPKPSIELAIPASLPDHLDEVEREIIRRALAKTQFNRTQAAELLGISFRQLRYRMQRLNIRESE
jgi:two-component system response regulator PilR (NtrC family)